METDELLSNPKVLFEYHELLKRKIYLKRVR